MPSYLQVTLTPVFVPLICLLGAVVQAARARRRARDADVVSIWVAWWFYGAMGVGGLIVFLSYMIAPDFMAGVLDFPVSVAFEHEVGVANLGFALAAVLSVRRSADARVVTAAGYMVFLYGATIGHLYETVVHGNLAPGNTGGILAYNLVIPAVGLGLARHQQRREPQLTGSGVA